VRDRPLVRFVVLVMIWLPVAFAVWYLLAPVILWPAQAGPRHPLRLPATS
jgi:hypothetical protein